MVCDLPSLLERFGLVVKTHRVGDLDLRWAEVDRADALVREIYPEGVNPDGDAPAWMFAWPAALALAEHLVVREQAAGLRVLELGCGAALPGIAAERAGAGLVVCTDCHPLALDLALYNGRLNGCTNLKARLLDWHRPDWTNSFDLVLGSEVVYFERAFDPLLSVLKRSALSGARILLSDAFRPQMDRFLARCEGEGFAWRQQAEVVHLPGESHRVRLTCLRHL